MGIADDMKGITRNIVASCDVRIKTLDNLVADTHKTLKGFASDRKKMGKEQAKNLADFVEDLSKSVEDMRKGFQKSHKQMSDDQARSLTDFVNNLTKDVGSMLNAFQMERGEMSKELKDKLAKGVEEIETYIRNKLKEFHDAHADMSAELRKGLDEYVSGIVGGVKKLLGEYSSDMKKARAAWQGMTATLEKKRGLKPKVKAEVKVRPVEEAVEQGEEEEGPPELGLEERVLEFVKSHPEGVKVGDMEDPLGVARTRLGVIAKRLLDEGKIRKEENMYFPM